MIELKWILPDGTTTLPPLLMYRVAQLSINVLGGLDQRGWSDWQKVPTELVSLAKFQEAYKP